MSKNIFTLRDTTFCTMEINYHGNLDLFICVHVSAINLIPRYSLGNDMLEFILWLY